MAALAHSDLQEATVTAALAALTLPKGVRLLRIAFDLDHSGDPAVRVVYGVSKRVSLTTSRVQDLIHLSRAAAEALERVMPDRISYVTFDDTK